MAQETIGIKIQVEGGDAVKSVGSLKQQLREAQNEVNELSEKFGATSKQAVAAATRAAQLKDAIGDAKALTDAFNPDAKFKAFTSTLSAVAGGFGAVQGALGLIGVESEEVEQTLLKVQSAMALSQGFQAIGEGIDSFKQLGAVIQNSTLFQKANNAATIIAAQVQKAFGVAVTGTGTAFKALRAVIISTGIGALVVGIGLLVSKIMDWTSSTADAEEAQARLNSEIEKQNDLLKTQLAELDYVTKAQIARARLANKSEAEITKIAADGQQKRLDILKKDFEDAIKRESSADFAKLGLEEQDKIRKENTEKQRAYANERDRIELEGLEKQAKNFEDANKKASEVSKANAEKRKQELEARAKEEEAAYKTLEDLRIANIQAELLRNIERTNLEFSRRKTEIENLKVSEQLKTSLIIEEEKKRDIALAEYRSGIAKQNEEAKKEAEVKDVNAKGIALNTEKIFQSGLTAITQARVQVDDEIEKKLQEARKQRASETIGILQNLTSIVGKDTVAGKALGIATALINTYQGASEAIKQKSTLPSPFDVVAKVANVGAIIATGLKTVKSITAVKVPGGGGGGGQSAPAFSSAPIPPTPTPQVQSTLLNAQAIQQLGNATSRAYVVESDVSSSQERIRRINRAARLG
jgi:hypothetical protein